ncbi:HAMP domain-containing sensor histidine kinase [Marinilabiliaceae bacterium ANBcel2]|nr:HAMP domain-containing sensor histidine kinase [Marinilabiliaceae bacterium ANBcel2]
MINLNIWRKELLSNLDRSSAFYIALFKSDGTLIFSNRAIDPLFKTDEPVASLINPVFDDLLAKDYSNTLIFQGILTIGDYNQLNSSIEANIYRKDDEILILGEVCGEDLLRQNEEMHRLNSEVLNLQRSLLKEKRALKSALKSLSSANEELNQHVNDKNRFISILAHDLKGPMGGVNGLLKILKRKLHSYDIDKIEYFVDTIHKTSLSTYNLLIDLLDWSRVQTGNVNFDPVSIKLYETCKEVVDGLDDFIENKGVIVDYSGIEGYSVTADYNMMKTVLRNLITNSLKYTKKGGTISVLADISDGFYHIKVKDTGIGMDSEVKNSLFDPNKKVSIPGTEGEGGTGLGLMLCKELVEKHGGKIWVESVPDQGSSFIFTIPL